jgi:hypothetical protein
LVQCCKTRLQLDKTEYVSEKRERERERRRPIIVYSSTADDAIAALLWTFISFHGTYNNTIITHTQHPSRTSLTRRQQSRHWCPPQYSALPDQRVPLTLWMHGILINRHGQDSEASSSSTSLELGSSSSNNKNNINNHKSITGS